MSKDKKTAEVRLDLYRKKLLRGRSHYAELIWQLCQSFLTATWMPGSSWRCSILRLFGAQIGKGVVIKPGVKIKFPWKLSVGNHVWLGENVWIDNLVKVTISDHVCISQGAYILTGNHNYKKSTFDLVTASVVLEGGVWIGARSIVSPGVVCKTNSILTAGSVATKNLEADGIYQGNPAVWKRNRELV